MSKEGQIWIRAFPDKPITKKPLEVRQGKGKGNVEYWVAQIRPGAVLYEMEGVSEEVAREALQAWQAQNCQLEQLLQRGSNVTAMKQFKDKSAQELSAQLIELRKNSSV